MSIPSSPRRHVADVIYDVAAKVAMSHSAESKIDSLPALSLYTFVASVMTLGSRIVKIGTLELGIAEFMSWERPSMTITMLIAYTKLCYQPQWIIILPLFYFVALVLIPNYAHKFKLDIHEIDIYHSQKLLARPVSEEERRMQDKSLLNAIRKGQKSLSKVVEILDKYDNFREGPAKFVDPQISCMMLIVSTLFLVVSGYALTFVSIPAFFSFLGWIVVLLKHPVVKSNQEKLDLKLKTTTDFGKLLEKAHQISNRNILLDDETLTREVEIFELQPQGLTVRQWRYEDSVYSNSPYDSHCSSRIHKQMPTGASDISDILPPEDWYFELSDEWKVDKNVSLWASEHHMTHLRVDDGWVYDDQIISADVSNIWRRRRLTRNCYFDFS